MEFCQSDKKSLSVQDAIYNISVGDCLFRDASRITNAYMYQLFLLVCKQKIKWKEARAVVATRIPEVAELSEITLRNACENIKKKRSKLQTRPSYPNNLKEYFDETFSVPMSSSSKKRKHNTASHTDSSAAKKLFEEDVVKTVNMSLIKDTCSLQDKVNRLEHENRQQKQANRLLQCDYDHLNQKCERKKKCSSDRRLKEKVSRKSEQAKRWRMHYTRVKQKENLIENLEKKVEVLCSECRSFRITMKKLKCQEKAASLKHAEELDTKERGLKAVLLEKKGLVHTVSDLRSVISDLENINSELQEKLDSITKSQLSDEAVLCTKRDKKVYDDRVRQCVYYCLAKELPVTNVSDVIGFVVETLAEKKLESLPSTASVCRMKQEMGVLSDLQAFDAIKNSRDVTLSFDGTTKREKHLNEIHLTTRDKSTICVGLGELPGGKAVDYHDHITSALQDLSQSAAEFHDQDAEHTKASVTDSIAAIVTDRCIVNHAVVSMLEETYKHDIVELKCNVHPLDTVATKANKALRDFDRQVNFNTRVFGNYSAAVNVIQALCKMRFKNGKGDPKGFKEFLTRKALPTGLLQRFVGNRIHIVFHMAGVIFCYRDSLVEYLRYYCPVSNSLRGALLEDLEKGHIILCLLALGLLGKLLTGPWMSLLYADTELKLSNLEMQPLLNQMLSNLSAFKDGPVEYIANRMDMFGRELDTTADRVLGALLAADLDDQVDKPLRMAAEEIQTAVTRQLHDITSKPLSEDLLEKTKSAPVHNMASEQVLGMCDYQINRAPNACTESIEAKVKFKKNKTDHFLKNSDSSAGMVSYAVGRARRLFLVQKERRKTNRVIFRHRQDETQLRRVEQVIKALIVDSGTANVTSDQLQNSLPGLTAERINAVVGLINRPLSAVGCQIRHRYYQQGQGTVPGFATEYFGFVEKLKKNKTPTYVVAYWQSHEQYDDGADENVTLLSVATDMLLGDLKFV